MRFLFRSTRSDSYPNPVHGRERNTVQDGKLWGICSRCLCGFCILCLAGCMVGPNFQPPETRVPSQWKGVESDAGEPISRTVQGGRALVEWWKGFNDSTLTSLIERGIESNLDMRQASSRIRQARAARGMGFAALWPTIGSNASYQRSGPLTSKSGDNPGGGSSVVSGGSRIEEKDLFQAGLDSSWELDLFGGTRRNIEALDAELRAAVEDRRDVLVSLIAEIGINYLSLRGAQQELVIARRNLDAQRRTAEITRKRYEAGFVSGLDLANAEAQAASTASQIPVLESTTREAIYSLGLLLGREPTSLLSELDLEETIPLPPPEVPVGLPSDLIRRRPDIRRAEAQLHAATARIGVATADLFPKFSLTGSLTFSEETLSSLARWSSGYYTLGPNITWPIFDAGKIRWNIEVQNALQEQALLTYEKTVLTALKEVETALAAYAKEQEHLRLLELAVENNRKAVELSTKLYVEGETDFLNVLTAQRSLLVSEEAMTQSTRDLALQLVALYKALGGGWNPQGSNPSS
ncbi:MAG: efflux transporter outer membrane subunit [Syntrophobacteraceae bacterium]|nr:efflux transporter outer membrane subunit [Syntrophobacteraceae bacterium]